MPVVIEIVARLGETTIDQAYVAPGSIYRFADRKLVAAPGHQRVGLVDVTMERIFRVDHPIAGPGVQLRPFLYIVASLALHIAIWAIAMTHAPLERLVVKDDSRRHYIHIEASLPPPPPPPPPKQVAATKLHAPPSAVAPSTANAQARRGRHATDDSAAMAQSMAEAFERVARSTPDVAKAMQGTGPLYNEDDANAKGFGGHRWDIDSDPEFDSVKTGPGYDLSELTDMPNLYGLSPEKKALFRIEAQTRLAHKSAIRGDCVPAHRIAKWLHKLDEAAYKTIYLGDPDIVYCLAQPVPPSFIRANK